MKKICYIVTIPNTIESFFVSQINFLANCGYDVTVICSFGENINDLLDKKVKYIPIYIPRGVSFFSLISSLNKLKKVFQEEQFDIVQYSTPNAAFCSSIASKKAGVKVRNYHLMGLRYLGSTGIMRFVLKKLEKITCKYSTNIECVSESNRKIGIQEGIFTEDKSTVVWNGSTGGVDLKRFDYNKRDNYRKEIREKYSIEPEEFVFGFVGRIVKDKGVNEILSAFSHIQNAKLFMIGALEDVNSLDKELYENSLNNENIIYTGNVDNVEKYFSAIDVLLLPSYREGFGNVVIEAAAMGTPAIVSDIPGPTDAIIPDVTAEVVEVKNSDSLLYTMRYLMNTDYKAFGESACKFVSDSFDSDKLNYKILERKKQLLKNI